MPLQTIGERGNVLLSLALAPRRFPEDSVEAPVLAALELRSRSACCAMAMGSWPSYSADMLMVGVGSMLLT